MSVHKTKNWAAIRERSVAKWGPRCWWCQVPTAATIEHLTTRSTGGSHWSDNLRLACPWCNFTRSDESVESWQAREGWKMPVRDNLPSSIRELADRDYGGLTPSGLIPTLSTNARLVVEAGSVYCEVRAGKDYQWRRVRLGPENHPLVVAAADEFLRRHLAKPGNGRPKPPSKRKRKR